MKTYSQIINENKAWAKEMIDKVDKKMSAVTLRSRNKLPDGVDENGVHIDNYAENAHNWTNGFFGGINAMLYDYTKNEEYLKTLDAEGFCRPDGKLDLHAFKIHLREVNTDWSLLIYNIINIYRAISTKDEQKSSYLSYIQSILNHRSSLKTYVNNGFSQVQGLANPEQYYILFDKEFNVYRVAASSSLFFISCDGMRIPVRDSSFWRMLISSKI